MCSCKIVYQIVPFNIHIVLLLYQSLPPDLKYTKIVSVINIIVSVALKFYQPKDLIL